MGSWQEILNMSNSKCGLQCVALQLWPDTIQLSFSTAYPPSKKKQKHQQTQQLAVSPRLKQLQQKDKTNKNISGITSN